ncbi:MAG TPA: methylenetetrahydrofolate--tRNA-(uracil(54)-C(5))-methyltransferase (FADH(2)-oxidizing) TrmFO [Candidatus Cloacimonadota bacterium]|nr:methylenetetrahydrofolate--tRNA-(uracil(54)-C(5))-methyltransferase (FADH(2)-oxidizing) TrmFO [Candidatus Cloacimonadota bacterium]HOH79200.1 methylenetetrahydrofolate--tRNA-(uracil(54)-C(5))-methyltransferase (FADH(2)-oxidizing) TrmFO [Candidatus Cloacimonadota bacterium]
MKKTISIIGAGLAGSEAALQLAKRGWEVALYEMRPGVMTPAHQTGLAAELVCSNSLKSTRLDTGAGMLKAEMALLGCQLLPLAEKCKVPAGHALAVDRQLFSEAVEDALKAQDSITRVNEEIKDLPDGPVIISAGPLATDNLMRSLSALIGDQHLYFFDAIAPIVDAASLDSGIVYMKGRYDKGEADYINCPFTKEQYLDFVEALLSGEQHQAHEFENEFFHDPKFSYYENCTPIEELARRGVDTLRHGVMRPMGLEDPRGGGKPYAVLQLRAENTDLTAYNLVGCQTMLRYGEQKRVFRLIPGLDQAEFLRYGSIHRNAYLDGPKVFNADLSLQARPDVWVAGQLSGVEGYVECIASALIVSRIISEGLALLPETSILGQLWRRLITPQDRKFQPVNANFGLLPDLDSKIRDKKLKKELMAQRGLEAMQAYIDQGEKDE